jgi:hypothetical protein
LNITKTKELVFDFLKIRQGIHPVCIKNDEVEIVSEYKYLGTIIDNKLDWNKNTQKMCAKANQRLYFLRKLRSFNVRDSILHLFYQSIIQSVITFSCIVWYNNLTVKNQKKCDRITKVASKIIGFEVKPMREILDKQYVNKLKVITQDPTHPLHSFIHILPTGRYRSLSTRTNRFRLSFLPSAIHLVNSLFLN